MLEELMDNNIYKILISKGIDKNNEYKLIKERLLSNNNFKWEEVEYKDYSEIDGELINEVDAVLILAGIYEDNKKEIIELANIANKNNKAIVLIRPYGMEEVPKELEDLSTGVIGWSPTCIVGAIKTSLGIEDEFF